MPEPTQYQAAELVRQLGEAGEDRQPCVRWPGVEVRRYRDLLYALAPLQLPISDWSGRFDGSELELPNGLGRLRLVGPDGTPRRIDPPLAVRFRRGGESLRLAGGGLTRELRDLFQEAGIPPWQRGRLPLVFEPGESGDALIAVADLWRSERGTERLAGADTRLEWTTADAAA